MLDWDLKEQMHRLITKIPLMLQHPCLTSEFGAAILQQKIRYTGEFDYLSLKVGDVGGRIMAGNFSLMYHVFDQFDIHWVIRVLTLA